VKQLELLQHNLLGARNTVNTYIPRWRVAGGISEESSIITKFAGKLEIEDLKLLKVKITKVMLLILFLVLLN
jgi:hypothetical protein